MGGRLLASNRVQGFNINGEIANRLAFESQISASRTARIRSHTIASERHVWVGVRQSIPSVSMASCASVTRPRSVRRLAGGNVRIRAGWRKYHALIIPVKHLE